MKPFPLSILTSDELYTAWKRLNQMIGTLLDADAFAVLMLTKLRQHSQSLGQALGRDQGSEFTDELADKDSGRDSSFLGFRAFITAFVHSADTAQAAAANLLHELIVKHGYSLHSGGYAAQTTKLNLLFADLDTAEAQQAITTIGADGWFTNLKTAQKDFEATYEAKVMAEKGGEQPLVSESRGQLARYLDGFMTYLDFQSEFDSAVYGPVVEIFDEVSTDVIAIARARHTRKENDGEVEPEV